jgi:hypothetical protein
MVRLKLLVEGQSEQTFASIILQPHLAQHQVFMHNPRLIAHARKKGKVHRGGSGYGDYQPEDLSSVLVVCVHLSVPYSTFPQKIPKLISSGGNLRLWVR